MKEALGVVWEEDRICGKGLKAVLPQLVGSLNSHGHLKLDREVKRRLLAASAATIDRLLAPVRRESRSGRKRKIVKRITWASRRRDPASLSRIFSLMRATSLSASSWASSSQAFVDVLGTTSGKRRLC